MTDTHGHIGAKGLDGTGITDNMLEDLFSKVGTHLMAIVDLQVVDKSGPNLKGKRKVQLVIDTIEPATTEDLADHLRELTRTLNFNRGTGHQPTLPGYDEPTVEGVLASGGKFRPHPFLPVDASDDNPICDVCGTVQATAVHSTQETLDDPDEDEPDDQTQDDADTEGDELDSPHAYDAGPDDSCLCGLAFGDEIHRYVGETGLDSSDDEEPEERHLATVPDPFTTPA